MFGAPKILQTDNGGEFVNHELAELCQIWNIQHINSRPYHPQTNGAVENSNKVLKRAIRNWMIENPNRDWVTWLPVILHSLNSQVHYMLNVSPYEFIFNIKPWKQFNDVLQILESTRADDIYGPIVDDDELSESNPVLDLTDQEDRSQFVAPLGEISECSSSSSRSFTWARTSANPSSTLVNSIQSSRVSHIGSGSVPVQSLNGALISGNPTAILIDSNTSSNIPSVSFQSSTFTPTIIPSPSITHPSPIIPSPDTENFPVIPTGSATQNSSASDLLGTEQDNLVPNQFQPEINSIILGVRKKTDAFHRNKIRLMKEAYDRRVEERSFSIGDIVGICLTGKEKTELPQSLRVANIPAKIVSKEIVESRQGHIRYRLCIASHQITPYLTQEVLIPLLGGELSYPKLRSVDANNYQKLPSITILNLLRAITAQHLLEVSGIPRAISSKNSQSSSQTKSGGPSPSPDPQSLLFNSNALPSNSQPSTEENIKYKCKVCGREDYARVLVSCSNCKEKIHDIIACKNRGHIMKNYDLIFCGYACAGNYNRTNFPNGITTVNGVEVISTNSQNGIPLSEENIPIPIPNPESSSHISSQSQSLISHPPKRKRAPPVIVIERNENDCCVCDIEIKNHEEFFNCFRCGLKVHHIRDCRYPLLQRKVGAFMYCSFKCERNQEIYEVKIVDEKLFKRGSSFIKKYQFLFSDNSKEWRNATTIDTFEDYRKMVNDFHRLSETSEETGKIPDPGITTTISSTNSEETPTIIE